MKGDVLKLLRDMVATPSVTFEERRVRELICAFLREEGIECGCVRDNILALNRHWDASKPTLMLCAHMDTVPASSAYSFDPHTPDYEAAARELGFENLIDADGNAAFVAGLGSNDDGGSVVSMISAFCHFYEAEDMEFNILLCLTCQEENSGPDGSRYLWGEYWADPASELESELVPGTRLRWPRPYATIIGEPTSGRVATSERGLLVIDGTAHGVSGHAARGEGVNALYIALDDIEKLRSFRFDKVSPLMGEVKLNVTQINAGTAHNVIPDSCSFVVDIRPTDCYSNAEIFHMLQAVCKSELRARNLTNRSSASDPQGALLRAVEAVGLECFSSPTTSDWIRTRCDAIKFGPGDSSRSHHANEYILESEIRDTVQNYIKLIENIRL